MELFPQDVALSEANVSEATVSGTVEVIRFRNEENGYVVFEIKPFEGGEANVTVTGTTAALWEAEEISATGKWITHPKYGRRFQADSIICIAPTSPEGIRRFLASGLIKGIGKIHAGRIVDKFGSDTLNVIEHHHKRLRDVEGIGEVRSSRIHESWVQQKGVRDVMIFLQSHGVGTGQASRIFRRYGQDSIAVVKQNPYRLCHDVWGFGFKTADSIALKLGIPKDSPERARAGLTFFMETFSEDGHCFLEEAEVLLRAQDALDVPLESLSVALQDIVRDGGAVKEDSRIYLARIYNAERSVARRLMAIADAPLAYEPIPPVKALKWAENEMKLILAKAQRDAISSAITNKVAVITGGPGVGKTTIIRALHRIFQARHLKICLAAPTGRAAKRMTESTGYEAKTIHRLLRYQPQTNSFEHNENNPIEADVIILDETSMVDIELMDELLRALPDKINLILVGDTDQLPSVGPGNVLGDIISSGVIPFTRLTAIFRQDASGLIVKNAHHINLGEELEKGDSSSDFFFIETPEPNLAIQRVCDLIKNRIPKKFHFRTDEIQVLTPMRKGILGTDNLNAVIQQTLNPLAVGIKKGGISFRIGDRVMQVHNNYDKDVYNGDIGFVETIDFEEQKIAINFDGKTVIYTMDDLDELVLAYATTIHKSQGSEYPAVIILISTHHYKLLQRNLIYTAVTRGKNLVCIVGSQKALNIARQNNEVRERRTTLSQRLQNNEMRK